MHVQLTIAADSGPRIMIEGTDLHADAIDGLDDLRAWTYKSAIEKTIPIYCTRITYDAIAAGFPYMISKAAASGGGALPSFDWQ